MMKPFHRCDRCKTPLFKNAALDAWGCPRCDRWAEPTCGDPACLACAARPRTPSMARRVVFEGGDLQARTG